MSALHTPTGTPSDTPSPVLTVPPAEPAAAASYFASRLAFHTDVADVHTAMESQRAGFVLIDTRSDAGWQQGHIPGAVHMPTREIADRARSELDPAVPVVTYCWGPGCDGATRAALQLATLGFAVKEMLGGIEYWIREGFTVDSESGPVRRPVDDLTAPGTGVSCAC
jgi:rhodanese-related sulfurtransferase